MFGGVWGRLSATPAGDRRSLGRLSALAAATVFAGSLTIAAPAASAVFVDATLGDVKPEQKVVVAHPQPVQLLFQFKTKGSPNAQVTKQIKPDVLAAVKDSGLFSEVGDGPAASGAVLNVVIDDVVTPEEMKAAAGQGFATGLTFGLAGTTVREHYVATLDYIPAPDAPKITRMAQHFLVIQMGLIKSAPTNVIKTEGGVKGALALMTHQIVANPLNALASDPGFAPAATTAAAAPPTPPTEPTPATQANPTPATPTAPAPATPAAQPTEGR
jgi:hypothetical protein